LPARGAPALDHQAGAAGGAADRLDGGARVDGDVLAVQGRLDLGGEVGVEGGWQDLPQPLQHRDPEPAGAQRLGHLHADVAGAHDHHLPGLAAGQAVGERQGVADGVQAVDPFGGAEPAQPPDRRLGRQRSGGDHEPVVAEPAGAAGPVQAVDLLGGRVDAHRAVLQPQVQPGRGEVGPGAVGQVVPVGHLTGDVVGDPADGVVGG
jgi:hypothetical protein